MPRPSTSGLTSTCCRAQAVVSPHTPLARRRRSVPAAPAASALATARPSASSTTTTVPLLPLSSTRSRGRRAGRGELQTVAVFTGIVQGVATVSSVDRRAAGAATLGITFPPGALTGVTIGASVAINGTCLTVVTADGDVASFDVVDETLRVTNLGGLGVGDAVNFERAARVGDEIGGHLVSGHVACLASLTDVQHSPAGDGNVTLRLSAPGRWGRYLLPKGFVALDGVSLTLGADVESSSGGESGGGSSSSGTTTFAVHLIPETLRATTLGRLAPGATLNLEVDAGTQAVVDAVEAAVEARLDAALRARGL